MNNYSDTGRQFTLTASSTNFARNRDAWLDNCQLDPELTPAYKNLATIFHRYFFNRDHHNATGELKAWPKWETLADRSGLSESTVKRGTKKLEERGHFEIERRYNTKKGKRDVNIYRGKHPVQPVNLTASNRSISPVATGQSDRRLYEQYDSMKASDSMNLRMKDSEILIQSEGRESASGAETPRNEASEARQACQQARPSGATAPSDSPSSLASPSTPSPPIPRAPLPPEAALVGSRMRAPPRGVAPPSAKRRGALAEDFEDWCAAEGRTPILRQADGSIDVPDWMWLKTLEWVAAGRPPLCKPFFEMTPPLGPDGDSILDLIP
jgi:hypothetical protein